MLANIKVVCAIILNSEGKILMTKRSNKMKHPLMWEFPGGKVKEGENSFAALKREIMEELNVLISTKHLLKIVEWDYQEKRIELQAIICQTQNENFRLTEHEQAEWFSLDQLNELPNILEADKEILADLNQYLQN